MSNESAAPVTPNIALQGSGPRRGKKHLGLIIAAAAAAGVVLLALLAAGGFFLYTDTQYKQAKECLEKKDYAGARQHLARVASFYGDAAQLKVFAGAGEALEEKRYDEAKAMSESLGGFSGAEEMAREADYRHASALLESGDYDAATGMFTPLAQAGYKDSDTMLSEIDYRIAVALADKGEDASALEAFKKLESYKDSKSRLEAILSGTYEEAVSFYRQNNYKKAREALELIGDYSDANKYLALIQAHETFTNLFAYDGNKVVFDQLTALGDFEDALKLRMSDVYILYRMEGRWRDGDGNVDMRIRFDRGESVWYFNETKMDFSKIKISDCIVYIKHDGYWDETAHITFTAENTFVFDVILLGRVYESYTLTRS